MVKKLKWQEVKRRVWSPTEPPASRLFSEPQWQEHVSLWYILYRWFIFGCWGTIIICSIFEIGSYRPEGKRKTWVIYLTHWDLILGVGHSALGAILVSRRLYLQRQATFDPDTMRLGKIEHVYWFLYTVTSSVALGVTILYWVAVYDPKIHTKDPLNFMLHLINSVLILVDLIIVGVPLRFKHFWRPLSCVLIYSVFTFIYYWAGGLDKNGYHFIYKILNWQKPGKTVLVCLGGFVFITIVHCVLCAMALLRAYVRTKATGRKMSMTINTQLDTKTSPFGAEFPLPMDKSRELIV